MNRGRALALRQRNVQRVAQQVRRRVVGPVRSCEDVLQIGGAEALDIRIVLDVIRVIHREEAEVERAVIERQVSQQQAEHHGGVRPPGSWVGGRLRRAGGRDRLCVLKLPGALALHQSGTSDWSSIPGSSGQGNLEKQHRSRCSKAELRVAGVHLIPRLALGAREGLHDGKPEARAEPSLDSPEPRRSLAGASP